MDLFKEGSLFSFVNTTGGAVTLAIVSIIVLAIVILTHLTHLRLFELVQYLMSLILKI